MARGIITNKPNAANPKGKISTTDGKTVPDDPAMPPGPDIEFGTNVEYSRSAVENVGDLVDFTTDATGNVTINSVVKSAKVITNTNNKVDVNAGDLVLINGTVDGKLTVLGGTVILADTAKIISKVECATDASVIISNGATITAKVEVTASAFLSLRNTTVEGKVTSDGTSYTVIRDCVIEGSLEIINAGECHTSGNRVDGNTNTPNCTP